MNKTKGDSTRKKVLISSMQLINNSGFNNTSINDIINETGIKKGNIYFHFQNKEELGLAILQESREQYLNYLTRHANGDSPLEKIFNVLNAIYQYHKNKNFIGGCIFGNTALEMSDINPRFTQLIQEIFEEWISLLTMLLKDAIKAGQLNREVNPDFLSRHIVASLEGSIMMCRLTKKGDPLMECIKFIQTLLEGALINNIHP